MSKDKDKQSLDSILSEINKDWGGDIIRYGVSAYDYKRIPFTSPRLNYITFGGIPMGKLIEFYGEEHGGKTTTALDIVANYQSLDQLFTSRPSFLQGSSSSLRSS